MQKFIIISKTTDVLLRQETSTISYVIKYTIDMFEAKTKQKHPFITCSWIGKPKLSNIIAKNQQTITDLSSDCVSAVLPDNNQPYKLNCVNVAGYFFDTNKHTHTHIALRPKSHKQY